MRPVNLRSVIIAHKNLPTDQRDELYMVWGIEPKPKELSTLEVFMKECDALLPNHPEQIARIVGECFFGFVIPRISVIDKKGNSQLLKSGMFEGKFEVFEEANSKVNEYARSRAY